MAFSGHALAHGRLTSMLPAPAAWRRPPSQTASLLPAPGSAYATETEAEPGKWMAWAVSATSETLSGTRGSILNYNQDLLFSIG